MRELNRRGVVVLIRRGDPEITGAIADGMLAAYGGARAEDRPEGKALSEEQIEVVAAEIDHQKILADLVKVAAGNTNTAEDYALMITKVRGDYQKYTRPAGPARRLGRRLLGVYGLIVYSLSAVYRAQGRLLDGRRA